MVQLCLLTTTAMGSKYAWTIPRAQHDSFVGRRVQATVVQGFVPISVALLIGPLVAVEKLSHCGGSLDVFSAA
jgi:hypothetical protein